MTLKAFFWWANKCFDSVIEHRQLETLTSHIIFFTLIFFYLKLLGLKTVVKRVAQDSSLVEFLVTFGE